MTLEDVTGSIEVIVFPKTLQRYTSVIEGDKPLMVRGRLSVQEDETKLIAEEIQPLSAEATCVHIRVKEKDRRVLGDLLRRHHGTLPLYIHVMDKAKIVPAEPRFWVRLDAGFVLEAEKLFGEGSTWVEED